MVHARRALSMAAITTAVVLCSSAVGYRVVAQRPAADTPPRLLNKAEVDQALARIYPPLVRDAGIGRATEVLVDVDRAGRAHGFRVVRTDHPALATAAEQALGIARFAPAVEGGVAVAGTFRYSARFSAPTLPVAGGRTSVSVAGARARLSNAGELTAAAARLYPPLVRAA